MVGESIGHYRILEKLGEGGMAEVWLAEDERLQRKVALKFLPKGLFQEQADRARFFREARAAARLNHPHISQVYGIEEEEEENRLFIVLEYLSGGTLRESRSDHRGEPISLRTLLTWLLQAAEGLAEAHRKGVIHRDIKPQNLMLDEHGEVKITDFGLALLDREHSLTRTGSHLGTGGYMSPEQIRGDSVDHRTDLFSLGTAFYELVTGRHPFGRDELHSTYYAVLNEDPGPPSVIMDDIPAAVDDIFTRLLQKDPDLRLQSGDELTEAIQSIFVEKGWSFPIIKTTRTRSGALRRWGVRVVAAITLLLIPVGWFFWPILREPRIVPRDYETSVAVLYFDELTSERDDDYLAEGLTEELISRLSRIGTVRVPARTDVLPFRDDAATIEQMARRLDVDSVLEGSVRTADGRLRVTARLISVQEQEILWSQVFDEALEGIFDVQDSVTEQIVSALKIQLTGRAKQRIYTRPTTDFATYREFLNGEAELVQWNSESLARATEFFGEAVRRDEGFADAHAYLAFSKLLRFYFTFVLEEQTLEEIRLHAARALGLNSRNEVALIGIIGYYLMKFREQQRLSIFELRDMIIRVKQLIRIDPKSPLGHLGVAEYYRWFRRDPVRAQEYLQFALERSEAILEAEPENRLVRGIAAECSGILANYAYAGGEFREAVRLTEYSIDLFPGVARTYNQLSRFYAETDQPAKARETTLRGIEAVRSADERGNMQIFLGADLVEEGRFEEAESQFENAMTNLADAGSSLYDYALLYRYLTLRRLGRNARADSLIGIRLSSLSSEAWPAPIIRYFAGETSQSDAVGEASPGWQLCEAYYFAGAMELTSGDSLRAARFFQDCLDTGVTGYLEYGFAEAELARLRDSIRP